MMKSVKRRKPETFRKNRGKPYRYPNLSTVLMIEKYLEFRRDAPMSVAELKRGLPKQVMHPTLRLALEYLWRSGKIIYGPKGVQWIFTDSQHLKEMLDDALEV